jgi:hypothetical protein
MQLPRLCWPLMSQLRTSVQAMFTPLSVTFCSKDCAHSSYTLHDLACSWPQLTRVVLHDAKLTCPLDCTDPVILDELIRSLYAVQVSSMKQVGPMGEAGHTGVSRAC